MARSYPDQLGPGSFVPITDIFDVSVIRDLKVGSPEFKEFLVRLRQSINDIAIVLNTKDSGFYVEEEFVNGQVYYPNPSLSSTTQQQPTLRQVFRKVIDFGTLPNNAIKSVAHGITIDANTRFTRIYGTATDPSTSFIPLPFASTTANENIKLEADGTNIIIETGIDRTGYTTCYIVLEYIKQ